MYGRNHKGMPGWRVIVERVRVLLADPEHPAWWGAGRGARAIAEMPAQVQSVDQLAATLLTSPSTLQVEVLEWLSDHLLYCAGPPYGRSEWEAVTRDRGLPGPHPGRDGRSQACRPGADSPGDFMTLGLWKSRAMLDRHGETSAAGFAHRRLSFGDRL